MKEDIKEDMLVLWRRSGQRVMIAFVVSLNYFLVLKFRLRGFLAAGCRCRAMKL